MEGLADLRARWVQEISHLRKRNFFSQWKEEMWHQLGGNHPFILFSNFIVTWLQDAGKNRKLDQHWLSGSIGQECPSHVGTKG